MLLGIFKLSNISKKEVVDPFPVLFLRNWMSFEYKSPSEFDSYNLIDVDSNLMQFGKGFLYRRHI